MKALLSLIIVLTLFTFKKEELATNPSLVREFSLASVEKAQLACHVDMLKADLK